MSQSYHVLAACGLNRKGNGTPSSSNLPKALGKIAIPQVLNLALIAIRRYCGAEINSWPKYTHAHDSTRQHSTTQPFHGVAP